MVKLTREVIVAIKETGQKDISNRKLAKLFGVDESTVRYHKTRGKQTDGRKNKPQKADQLAGVISYLPPAPLRPLRREPPGRCGSRKGR